MVNHPLVPQDGTFWDLLFHQTYMTIAVAGYPAGGYTLTFIGLVIIAFIALATVNIAERLTGGKVGGLIAGVIITIVGSAIASSYLNLPFDYVLENVHIISATIGAFAVAILYALMRKQGKSSGGGH